MFTTCNVARDYKYFSDMTEPFKISWANCNSIEQSDFVFIGIPDESHSHSIRPGTSKAPNKVRNVSWDRDVYSENGIMSKAYSNRGTPLGNLYDYGNIARKEIPQVYSKVFENEKIPITIGGDHSLTTSIVTTLGKKTKPISLVYFDAHPDFLSSTTDFYGSVIYDVLPFIDLKSSVMIGIRSPEQEEVDNIRKYGIKVITAEDIQYFGVKQTLNEILSILGKNIYVSFDMDCLDPSFAPGVSVPVPLGLDNITASILLKGICKNGVMGLDIMEICPEYDIQDFTSHLASRMVCEFLAVAKIPQKILHN